MQNSLSFPIPQSNVSLPEYLRLVRSKHGDRLVETKVTCTAFFFKLFDYLPFFNFCASQLFQKYSQRCSCAIYKLSSRGEVKRGCVRVRLLQLLPIVCSSICFSFTSQRQPSNRGRHWSLWSKAKQSFAYEPLKSHTHTPIASWSARQCRSTHQAQVSCDDATASPFLQKEIIRLRLLGRRCQHLFKSNLIPKNSSSLLLPPLALDDVRAPYRCIPCNGVGGGARLLFSAQLTETTELGWRSHFRGS